ncbi:hypothetical protein [Olivibacter domesticus]|uniref:DUF3299 domain-containing protein n=1 Tax=Olivibacter domesticus TaxID=407022 RepID=A0A1H7QBD0_OLID1|nr:hypothetical protein [Olivibacter domesticus]SEL45461.1 hypothetical protein SAMN05661044_02537 [Olivibacter domesticus]
MFKYLQKSFLLVVLLLSFSYQVKSQLIQNTIPDHKPMMTAIWEKFDLLMYKVITMPDGTKTYTPHFPQELKALDNKNVTLPGYMIPLKVGRDHHTFMLSVLPVMQCMFCGQNGIPPLVQIVMRKGKVRFTDEPFKINGTIHLNQDPDKGAEIQLLDASLSQ